MSGTSEVSGVAGDGEREQAVTEEEDMATLHKGEEGVRYGLCSLSPVRRNYQTESRSTGPDRKTRDGFLEAFTVVKYSVVYQVCVVVVVFAGLCNGGYWSRRKCRLSSTCISPTPATMKRVADSQLTKDTDDGDEGPEVNGLWSMRRYPKFTSTPQEVGVGFKKASDSELVNRRCARPSPQKAQFPTKLPHSTPE